VDLALARIEAKQAEAARLTAELRQIAGLGALGIVREDIVGKRPVLRYSHGRLLPSPHTQLLMRDGTEHIVPSDIIR